MVVVLGLLPALAGAQETVPPTPVSSFYVPPTPRDRVTWVVQGTISLPVVGYNALDAAWSTTSNRPEEWGRGLAGFGRRFADESASTTIEDAIEAGAGALWGEDPRYRRSGQPSTWRRVHHAVFATILAPRRDGHLAPAWGRFTAIAAASQIQNGWLPPSARTPSATAWRMADDVVTRALVNVWDEFWPDVRKWLPAPAKHVTPQ
jgi:hypothetical protein